MLSLRIVAGMLLVVISSALVIAQSSVAQSKRETRPEASGISSGYPHVEWRDHLSSKVEFTVTNFGMFGSIFDDELPEEPQSGIGCVFPTGSGIQHLLEGALWVGAIVGTDTLVSTALDGWQLVHEMYPDAWPAGSITLMSNQADNIYYSPDAIANEEYIAVYYDTLVDPALTRRDPFDNRPHKPLGIEITQHSYSFGGAPNDDFILLRFSIKNIGNQLLEKTCFGLYLDTDVWSFRTPDGFSDDFAGSRWIKSVLNDDSLFVAYAIDDDGDPSGDYHWNSYSARSVFSVTLLDVPFDPAIGFNWWISHGDPLLDWGPRLQIHDRDFGTDGGLGTPSGDRNKYYMMSTPEIDYDQLWASVDMSQSGWLPPSSNVFVEYPYEDTRFLLSCGSVDIAPGETVHLGFAVVMAENIHTQPRNFRDLFDGNDPQQFHNSLNFTDLEYNVRVAQSVYNHYLYGTAGDADHSSELNLADVVFLVNHLFLRGSAPKFKNGADVNGDCEIDLKDIVLLIRYLYDKKVELVGGCVE